MYSTEVTKSQMESIMHLINAKREVCYKRVDRG